MEEKSIKELFSKGQYDEVIEKIEKIYSKLFIDMLDLKSEELDKKYESLDYDKLSALVLAYYPQYTNQILTLNHVANNPDNTYFEVINTMLNIYMQIYDSYNHEDRKD